MIVNNPIIRGFYPDPSVCKANGKYYMVCSSMQYFPGVPLFESSNLINWKQIGHCLTRPSQVQLHQINSSGGVFAPTIRFHEGTFYMVTTNDTYHKNFYVTTTDITGEWSDPVFVDQEGIDPSLFFENGITYFMSNGLDAEGNGCILQCEINPITGERLTESIPIWGGTGGRYLESPHLYHFDDWYYLMVAEGGTEYGHMITYARGKTPYGPFHPYPTNPVLTNRNMGGPQSLIQGIGHGDLIQDDLGNTFLICLGFRQANTWVPYHHLGREVFLVPTSWKDNGWFQAGIHGVVLENMEVDVYPPVTTTANYDASLSILAADPFRWCYLRDPDFANYQILTDKIRLKGTPVTLNHADSPTFLGIRQSEFYNALHIKVKHTQGEAGITYYMDENHHYDLATVFSEGKKSVILRLCVGDLKTVIKQQELTNLNEMVSFLVISDPIHYSFHVCINKETILLGTAQAKYLSSEVAGGFTGVIMAMYAVNEENQRSDGTADSDRTTDSDLWAEFYDFTWRQQATDPALDK